ncbi:hypothetical protein H5410_015595, partial [Solanum commersonii]
MVPESFIVLENRSLLHVIVSNSEIALRLKLSAVGTEACGFPKSHFNFVTWDLKRFYHSPYTIEKMEK